MSWSSGRAKQFQDSITCGVCLEEYQDPKMLFCRHSFCKECLETLNKRQRNSILTCPTCREQTYLSDNGVDGLEAAFHIQQLLEAKVNLEEDKIPCAWHAEENITFYCDPCEALICNQCVLQGHQGHIYKGLGEKSELSKQELSSELRAAGTVLERMDILMTKFQERGEEISAQQSKLEDEINGLVSQLQQALESKRLSLINELQKLASKKLTSLNVKKSEVNNLQIELESSIKQGQFLMKDRKEIIIAQKDNCIKVIKQASSDCREFKLSLPEDANMGVADNLDSTLQSLESFATIVTCDGCPEKCYAKGSGLSSGTTGEASTVTVYVMDNMTQPCKAGILESIRYELVSSTGKQDSGVAKWSKGNQYELSYVPESKGYHQLSITVRDQHIYSSPFQVVVKSPISTLLVPSQAITAVESPSGIAVNRNGDLLVVNEKKQSITVFKQGSTEVDREIKGVGIFADLTVADDNTIYAVSMNENFVAKFSPDGTLVKISAKLSDLHATKKGAHVKFNSPKGIAFNSKNKRLYISNTNSHEILVLDEDLDHCNTIGREGTGKLQFKFPRGICCDSAGKVYVADSKNDRIQVFSAEGKFSRMFGQTGEQPGHLKWPLGVATSSEKHIYVSEGSNDRVSIFGPSGNFLRCFGGEGIMKKPCGIAVDSNCGTVLVCSYGFDLIQVY